MLERRWDTFRRALWGDPPANVEPQRVVLEPDARPVKARPRVCSPVKTAWLAARMAMLIGMELVTLCMQGVWPSSAMAVTKKHRGCLVCDCGVVNKQMQRDTEVMLNPEAETGRLRGASAWATLDLLQVYWRCLLGV